MGLSHVFHKLFSVLFMLVLCNALIMPAFYSLSDRDFDYQALVLAEEETKNVTNIVEEEEKLFSYVTIVDASQLESKQVKKFLSRKLFFNDDYFIDILLPPPEQNLV